MTNILSVLTKTKLSLRPGENISKFIERRVNHQHRNR